MIADIRKDPAMPIHWGKNEKGMQAYEETTAQVRTFDNGFHIFHSTREEAWKLAMENAISVAKAFHEAGYHKQVVNRLLEPFMHINVVVTSTEWSNFFALRDHPDAEPHIQLLAKKMKQALTHSKFPPKVLREGEWHLPYIYAEEFEDYTTDNLLRMSVARCARVSYLTHEGKPPSKDEDLALYERLVASEPLHASPAEHQATPDPWKTSPALWGNFREWIQYRKILPGECQ
jgi:hypothetical protein